jgi:electron transfer flavoprotein-quinone oxidoreductase
MRRPDVIVVGAGPAGVSAALGAARKGLQVVIVERGETAGSKNMFGGMIPNCPSAEELLPGFWERAPWERHVVKRTLTILSEASATSLAFESDHFDSRPYNGYTLFRPVFDRWFANEAVEAGATLLTNCLAEELIVENGSIKGVRIGRDAGELRAPVTILSDGVLSLLARKQGLSKPAEAHDVALGVKALFRLREQEINDRFGLVRRQGATQEFLGCTEGIRGGGFIYTQTETLSVGVVTHLDSLKARGIAPYDLLQGFLARDAVSRLLKGAQLIEYSAHVLPEGGYKLVPRLFGNGVLLAGDAAGLCYTNGLNQEGMNLAITSGFFAAQTVLEAFEKGDFSERVLSRYESRLKESFVLKDMSTFAGAAGLMHNDRLFSVYPNLVGTVMEELYRSDGLPKKAMGKVAWDAAREAAPLRVLISDLLKGGGSLI